MVIITKHFGYFELFITDANEDIPFQRALIRCQKRGLSTHLFLNRIYKRLNKKAHE